MLKTPWILAGLLAASSAWADEDRTEAPYFVVQGEVDALPLKETRAKAVIAGVIAHVRVTQVYQNEGSSAVEAQYVFPGSTRAAVFAMEMQVGERTIVADIAEKKSAQKRYEKAKAQGKSASLLQQHRPNVFSMSVANIMPGDRIEVRLDYTELLVPERGVYQWVYPSVVGPRFTGESSRDEGWTNNPHLPEGPGAAPYRWGVEARIAAGLPVSGVKSTTHPIAPSFNTQGAVQVQVLDEAGGDRDFILEYRLDGNQIESGVMLYEGDDEKFFTAIVQPPRRIPAAMVPPREYLFVLDVSGSMGGFPLRTAKKVMGELIDGLRAEDRFNVLYFAGQSGLFSPKSVHASPENKRQALALIGGRSGGGGTHLLAALDRAYALPRTPGMSSSMVVVTDGYVSVEPEVLDRVAAHLDETNVFTFGIGSSVNRHLVESMARVGRGRPFVVTSGAEAETVARRFRQYVERPVLTDVTLDVDGLEAYDVLPEAIPDLFGERPIVIMGKYRGAAQGTLRISGASGRGTFTRALDVGSAHPSDDLVALRHLWARDRVRALADRRAVGADHEEEITALGLRYGLMTEFTSFIAIDDNVRNHSQVVTTVRQPSPAVNGLLGALSANSVGMGGLGTRGTGAGGGGYGKARGRVQFKGGSGVDRNVQIQSGSPMIMGSLDKSIIQRVIRRQVPKVRYCYEKQLLRNPNLFGKVVVQFTIDATGRVKNARIKSSTLKDQATENCIISALKSMKFPKPHGGGIVVVNYPFVFTQKK